MLSVYGYLDKTKHMLMQDVNTWGTHYHRSVTEFSAARILISDTLMYRRCMQFILCYSRSVCTSVYKSHDAVWSFPSEKLWHDQGSAVAFTAAANPFSWQNLPACSLFCYGTNDTMPLAVLSAWLKGWESRWSVRHFGRDWKISAIIKCIVHKSQGL